MNEFKDFKKVKLSSTDTLKLIGGTGGSNASEDVPITNLGTIAIDGEG